MSSRFYPVWASSGDTLLQRQGQQQPLATASPGTWLKDGTSYRKTAGKEVKRNQRKERKHVWSPSYRRQRGPLEAWGQKQGFKPDFGAMERDEGTWFTVSHVTLVSMASLLGQRVIKRDLHQNDRLLSLTRPLWLGGCLP